MQLGNTSFTSGTIRSIRLLLCPSLLMSSTLLQMQQHPTFYALFSVPGVGGVKGDICLLVSTRLMCKNNGRCGKVQAGKPRARNFL